ncbi:MAG: 50S ribosomal protein L29 [Candidatus Wildermuthbacteria bacterium]|nr:50S ribosomal protein L29 [Candidatus Wildermuthbacteria bacterium]
METAELQKKSKQELSQLLKEQRAKLQQLRFDLAAGKVKNIKEIRAIRKTIARIYTLAKMQETKSA